MKEKAIIIGAGIGGIAAAIRLAVNGYQVQVFEANSYAGGKLSQIKMQGFRFDAGPSLFTLPHLVDELFELANKNPKDYFEYDKLDVICQYFWEDGTQLTAFANEEKFAQEVEEKLGVSKQKVLKHLEKSAYIYQWTKGVFLEKSLHKLNTFTNTETLKAVLRLPKLGLNKTMHQANSVFQNEKLTQLFNRFATYNGSNPYQARATLNTIPHLEHALGAFAPKGGMYEITKSLYKLAENLDVQFTFNLKVEKIVTKKNKAIGINVNSKFYPANVVVSNVDIFPTYKKLLPEAKQPQKILNRGKSSSALIFYWGMNKIFANLKVHNIFFSDNYKAEFDTIFNQKTIAEDSTVYVNIGSKYAENDAPQGKETWFVMINVPANEGQNWDELIAEARKNIIAKLSRILKIDIEKLIACEAILEPRTIESKTGSHKGALYGSHSNDLMSAFFRHPNFSRKIDNLYFVGGSVHPGGGIPLCLLSAKIVDGLL